MAEQSSLGLKICNWIMKYSIYALMFLMPIFFLPWTSEVLDFNKQTLMLVLVFASLFAWMMRVLVSGKFEINLSKIHIFVGILFLSGLLSTVFSVYRSGSFWGWPQSTTSSFLTVLSLTVLYFLVSNTFSKKDIFVSTVTFSTSFVLAQIIGIFQLFGLYMIPFDFARATSFNTIGSAGSLGFLSAILLPLGIVLLIVSKKWWKVLFGAQLALSMIIFFVVDYPIVWWAVIVAAFLVMVLMAVRRDIFDGRWMSVPVFFLAISLFFVLLNPSIFGVGQNANEIFLSQNTSLQMVLSAIKEMPVFGSGLGTFAYDFSKFKTPDFSQSSLWSVTFTRGASEFLSNVAMTGVFGTLALIALVIAVIVATFRSLIVEKITKTSIKAEDESYLNRVLVLAFVSSFLVECMVFGIYNANIVLYFVFFFAMAALVELISKEKQMYELKPSSLTTLIATFVFTLAFIFGLGILILDGQRYVAEVNYYKGLVQLNAEDIDGGAKKIESAATINPASDLYFRQLSQVYLLQLQQKVSGITTETLTDDQKTEIQTLVANSVNAGKLSTDLNSKSVTNWSSRGYVYQNLFGFLDDANTWAINSYEEALKLDPNNPYLYAQEGYVNFISAYNLGEDKTTEKNQLLTKAEEQLQKSLALNSEYSNALYYLGLVYNAMGYKDKAIEQFEKVKQLNSNSKETQESIQKIIDTLKSGGSAGTEAMTKENPLDTGTSTENPVKNPPETTTEEAE